MAGLLLQKFWQNETAGGAENTKLFTAVNNNVILEAGAMNINALYNVSLPMETKKE